MGDLPLADPEVAATKFAAHLDALWQSGLALRNGWRVVGRGNLFAIVEVHGVRSSGERDPYFAWLGAQHYDLFPPQVRFVYVGEGGTIQQATGTKWWPVIQCPPQWFALHAAYSYGNVTEQLVCFSHNADYYRTHGEPQTSQRWKQGRHTVSMTLHRLTEVLRPPYYAGPSPCS